MQYKLLKPRIILLVGMMGVGKTSLGRILSKKLGLPFFDSDKEIEKSTGFSIRELFSKVGWDEFRLGEERVMHRLLEGEACVLSSGGGAFLSEKTREIATQKAISIWIKASSDVISKRTQGRTHRPLVPSVDNQKTIERLVEERYPIYSEADIMVESFKESPYRTVNRLLKELETRGVVEKVEDLQEGSVRKYKKRNFLKYKKSNRNHHQKREA